MPQIAEQNARVLDQFTQQAEAYAALANSRGSPLQGPMVEVTRPSADEAVLDVGCGSGQFAVALAPHVRHVTGVDLTSAMLDQARALQAKAGIANIDWIEADSLDLPFADGAFDLVVSRSMFHHAADTRGTLAEMRRACKLDGRIAILDVTPAHEKSPAFDAIETLRDPSHRRALTSAELRALGTDLGLKETATQPHKAELPFEMVLATSFPPQGMLLRVRELVERDAASGKDVFGLGAHFKEGQVWVTYPMTLVVWGR
jgi:SAM-dependent methyltransferase